MLVEERIKELGFSVPEAPKPLAAYVPAVVDGKTVYTSGQLPMAGGKLEYTGVCGQDISDDNGIKAAQLCALNCLSVIKAAAGSLENVDRIIKVTVFVNSGEQFTLQPKIANGASEFFVDVFGEKGKHARSAVGVYNLPLNAPVEVEVIAKLK